MKKILILFLALTALCFYSCESREEDGGKPSVVATIFPQYDIARTIAKDMAKVDMLLPFGAESHGYEPTMSDMKKVSDCDIFIYAGDKMESWASRAAEEAQNKGAIVIDLSKVVSNIIGHGHDIDPHIWLDPQNAIEITNAITDALCKTDSANADLYLDAAIKYTDELERLNDRLWELAEKPNGHTLCFGGKFAFAYITDKYGFKYLSAYDDCSHSAEPTAADIAAVIKAVKDENIKIVYHEELSEPKTAQTIADETGAELCLLHSCHNISEEDHTAGVSFLMLMDSNIDNIEKGLFD